MNWRELKDRPSLEQVKQAALEQGSWLDSQNPGHALVKGWAHALGAENVFHGLAKTAESLLLQWRVLEPVKAGSDCR